MDKKARAQLLLDIAKQSEAGGEIAVPLDLFFVGNDDPGSIGCNLGASQPFVDRFHRTLATLQERPDVRDIWVRISDVSDEDSWPYSDTVYVISSLSQDEIEAVLETLQFSEITPGWMYGKPASVPEPEAGSIPYSIWWD